MKPFAVETTQNTQGNCTGSCYHKGTDDNSNEAHGVVKWDSIELRDRIFVVVEELCIKRRECKGTVRPAQ
jgi:hypothetical protein